MPSSLKYQPLTDEVPVESTSSNKHPSSKQSSSKKKKTAAQLQASALIAETRNQVQNLAPHVSSSSAAAVSSAVEVNTSASNPELSDALRDYFGDEENNLPTLVVQPISNSSQSASKKKNTKSSSENIDIELQVSSSKSKSGFGASSASGYSFSPSSSSSSSSSFFRGRRNRDGNDKNVSLLSDDSFGEIHTQGQQSHVVEYAGRDVTEKPGSFCGCFNLFGTSRRPVVNVQRGKQECEYVPPSPNQMVL